MLSTIDAFRYAFSEIWKRRDFWVPIALLYVLVGSIRIAFLNYEILFYIVFLIEILLYIVVIKVTIKAIANKEYYFRDILLKPVIFIKACLHIVVIISICGILTIIPFSLIFLISTFFFNSSTVFGITMMNLLSAYIFARLFFAPYYFFDKKMSIWQCVKESWKDSNLKIFLSILLYILCTVILYTPLFLLDKVLSFYLYSSLLITPIGQLAGAHLYMQLQNKKDKQTME